jgi:hypothetical protein
MVVMDVCELLWCEIEERKRDIEEPETQINDRLTEKRKRERRNLIKMVHFIQRFT